MNATTLKSSDPAISDTRQFVLLTIGEETYGIDIGSIHGIIMPQAVTEIPRTAPHVKGVTNLRGSVLTVLDMRVWFGLNGVVDARHSRFIVVDAGDQSAALIVDAVSEVARIALADVEAPSQLLNSEASDCFLGVARLPGAEGDRLVTILDAAKLLEVATGCANPTAI